MHEITQGYEGVEPYIYDLQSKCIALCNISLFLVHVRLFKCKNNLTKKKNTFNIHG